MTNARTNRSNLEGPRIRSIESGIRMCPVCAASIDRSDYEKHDCASGMVLWKVSKGAIYEFRRIGLPIPEEVGKDVYKDERLFVLDSEGLLNPDFLGLGGQPAILKVLLEILVDGIGDPKMDTRPDVSVAEGGNLPDNRYVGAAVPRGPFEGKKHRILKTEQVREHLVNNAGNHQRLKEALGERSLPAPRIVPKNTRPAAVDGTRTSAVPENIRPAMVDNTRPPAITATGNQDAENASPRNFPFQTGDLVTHNANYFDTNTAVSSDPETPVRSVPGIGDLVRHTTFGEGVVMECLAISGNHEVTVHFKGVFGIKRLLLSIAPMEII